MTPDHANRLLMALQENIAKYEEAFGPISKDNDASGFNFPMNYNGPIGEA
jgi:hypothetical protein